WWRCVAAEKETSTCVSNSDRRSSGRNKTFISVETQSIRVIKLHAHSHSPAPSGLFKIAFGDRITQQDDATKAAKTASGAEANIYVGHCDAFASMNSAERRELVHATGLCFNCLRPGHAVRARCPFTFERVRRVERLITPLLHEGARKRAASSHEPGPPAKTRSTSLATREKRWPQGRMAPTTSSPQSRPD
ncbi:unnamed protein product, partial [Trichogramma brassicae]